MNIKNRICITDIKGAIFDMDGVLLDSMPMWEHAGEIYLEKMGKTAEEGLEKVLFTMTMDDGAKYIQSKYCPELDTEEIKAGMNRTIADFYEHEVKTKLGAEELLGILAENKIPVTVATSTDRVHVEAALSRLNILRYINRIFTCSEVGVGKTKPDIYQLAAESMGACVSGTYVFEDAYHAAQTAHDAGFKVVGLYDEASRDRQDELREYCDYYYNDLEDAAKHLDLSRQQSRVRHRLPAVLSIAGSDCSGGAGIQADLKTMLANGVYGMSAITALTAQNTTGVTSIMNVTPQFLAEQIDAVFSDIRPQAVKIGMVSETELIDVIAERLSCYKAENVIVDPVMVATSGARLISEDAVSALTGKLFPLARLITPNIPEAEALAGMDISDKSGMERAAVLIHDRYSCAVLVKGGHSIQDASDLLYDGGETRWFAGEHIDNPNTHGTGCTLSSAIASNIANGMSIEAAVEHAKAYISVALSSMLDMGRGSGPLDHGACLRNRCEV